MDSSGKCSSGEARVRLHRLMPRDDVSFLKRFHAGYETHRIYDVVRSELGFCLVERFLTSPFVKSYPSDDIADDLEISDAAWLAMDGEGVNAGLATARYENWNRSMLITGIFVAPEFKRQGIGRLLLDEIESYARSTDARCLMLETQNTNAPAIDFYLSTGFRLSGINAELYDPNQVKSGEAAIYFIRQLA